MRYVSLDRGWISPKLARQALASAIQRGYLDEVGPEVQLAFDLEDVRVPFDWVPDAGALAQELSEDAPEPTNASDVPLFIRIARRVASRTQQSTAEVVAAANKQQASLDGLLTAEASALLIARLNGVDVAEFLDEAWAEITALPTST